MTADTGTT